MVAIAGMPPANAAGLAHEQAALEATLDAVMQAVTAGDEQALLLRLREAAVDPQLSALERDQLLMGMISDLRGMPPGSIGPDTFTYLTDYPPQATMPHEESPLVPVPVHNIRAAASGLRNAWQRVESAYAGALLLTMDSAALVQAYGLHDEWPVRQGLLMALDSASHGRRTSLLYAFISSTMRPTKASVGRLVASSPRIASVGGGKAWACIVTEKLRSGVWTTTGFGLAVAAGMMLSRNGMMGFDTVNSMPGAKVLVRSSTQRSTRAPSSSFQRTVIQNGLPSGGVTTSGSTPLCTSSSVGAGTFSL